MAASARFEHVTPESVDRKRRELLLGAGSLALASASSLATAPAPTESEILDIIVIGAGLAGLTAARDLLRAGNSSFVVLEARDRVGGRTLNHQLHDGYISEAGGQWIGPNQTAIADLARELGIGTFKSEYQGRSVFLSATGRFATDTHGKVDLDRRDVMTQFDALARTLDPAEPWASPNAAPLDRISLGEWLESKHIDAIDFLTWQFASILTAGVSVNEVSLLDYLTMVHSAGGFQGLEAQKDGAQETRFVGGSQILSIKMADQIGDRLRLGHAVTRIDDWDQPVVKIQTPKQLFRARAVVVALSPPLCRAVSFFPALPKEQLDLQRCWPAHAPMMKSATVYPRPFWFEEGYNGQVASGVGPVIWSFDNSPPDHHFGVINAFLRAGETPVDHDAAMKAVTDTYARAMQDDRFRHPLEFHLQDWGQEPYTLSCVSPLPPGFLTSGLMPHLGQPVGSLIWAGTETADIWKGYMDGAVRSGHRAALQALQHLSTARSA